jgi:thiamine biosynthesis lipoprotein
MLRMATAAMGTRFELVLPDGERHAGELALSEIDDWHRRLSRFAPDSWVSHVNRTAASAPVRCDDETWAMLRDAVSVWAASDGAFDITRGAGAWLRLDDRDRTVAFGRPGMSLDLGGIGKGHAIDCAVRCLRESGVTSAFLHGGTSSGYGLGTGGDGRPWRVRVDDRVIELRDLAYSVSDAAGQASPHIMAADGRAVVSGRVCVTDPSARLADAWSTAKVILNDSIHA